MRLFKRCIDASLSYVDDLRLSRNFVSRAAAPSCQSLPGTCSRLPSTILCVESNRSKSGHSTPAPPPKNFIVPRCLGDAFSSVGKNEIGVLTRRPSSRSTCTKSFKTRTAIARSVLSRKALRELRAEESLPLFEEVVAVRPNDFLDPASLFRVVSSRVRLPAGIEPPLCFRVVFENVDVRRFVAVGRVERESEALLIENCWHTGRVERIGSNVVPRNTIRKLF